MIDFAALGRAAEALLHKDEVRLFRPVLVPDGMGSQRPGEPEDLGAIRGNLQSYSAERAQAEYGVTCKACGKALTPEEYRRHLHPPDKPEKTPDKQPRTRKKVQDDAEP